MTESTNVSGDGVRVVIGSLAEVGVAWARYGLTVARASIDAQAKMLDALARGLGEVADRLARKAEAADEPEIVDATPKD